MSSSTSVASGAAGGGGGAGASTGAGRGALRDSSSQRSIFSYSVAGFTGLPMWSFMPAARQASRSAPNALAVIATMGVESSSGTVRIRRVASRPSISGICMSIRIRS